MPQTTNKNKKQQANGPSQNAQHNKLRASEAIHPRGPADRFDSGDSLAPAAAVAPDCPASPRTPTPVVTLSGALDGPPSFHSIPGLAETTVWHQCLACSPSVHQRGQRAPARQ